MSVSQDDRVPWSGKEEGLEGDEEGDSEIMPRLELFQANIIYAVARFFVPGFHDGV